MAGTAVERLRAALAARDVDAVLAATSEDVVVVVDGVGEVVGHEDLRRWLTGLRDGSADSRWVVQVATRGGGSPPAVEDEVVLAWQPVPADGPGGDGRWVVVAGSVRLEPAPGDGPVRRARVRLDRAAVDAQLAGAARLPASSVRTEVALATFDPQAPAAPPEERVVGPTGAAGRRPDGRPGGGRRAVRAVLGVLLVLLLAVAALVGLAWAGVLPAGLLPDGVLPDGLLPPPPAPTG